MISQFYHRNDQGVIKFNLTPQILFLTSFAIRDKIKPGLGDLIVVNERGESVFYCETCRNNLSADEVNSYCSMCGTSLPTINLFTVENTGGVYCESCSNNINGNKRNLYEIMRRFSIN